MKTLVIHPEDWSTDFLSEIYRDKGWTVITENLSTKFLMEKIKSHDRIIMLGHGTPSGLIGDGRIIINSSFVYLLREKICVAVWCNADDFFLKYKLKGFYTGMVISEYMEAQLFNITNVTPSEITESNELLAEAIHKFIDEENPAEKIKEFYKGDNPVICFNLENIYQTE